jgi:hypothetical protein
MIGVQGERLSQKKRASQVQREQYMIQQKQSSTPTKLINESDFANLNKNLQTYIDNSILAQVTFQELGVGYPMEELVPVYPDDKYGKLILGQEINLRNEFSFAIGKYDMIKKLNIDRFLKIVPVSIMAEFTEGLCLFLRYKRLYDMIPKDTNGRMGLTEQQAETIIKHSLDTPTCLLKIFALNGYTQNYQISFQHSQDEGPEGSLRIGKIESRNPWKLFQKELREDNVFLTREGAFLNPRERQVTLRPMGLMFNYNKYAEKNTNISLGEAKKQKVVLGENVTIAQKDAVIKDKQEYAQKMVREKGRREEIVKSKIWLGVGAAIAAPIAAGVATALATWTLGAFVGLAAQGVSWGTNMSLISTIPSAVSGVFLWLSGVKEVEDEFPRWSIQSLMTNGVNIHDFEYMTIVFNSVSKTWFSEMEISIGKPPSNKQFIYDEKLFGPEFIKRLKSSGSYSSINKTKKRAEKLRGGNGHNSTCKT